VPIEPRAVPSEVRGGRGSTPLKLRSTNLDADELVATLAAALVATASRNGSGDVVVAYRGPELRRRGAHPPHLGARWVPLRITMGARSGVGELARSVAEERARIEAHGDYRADLVGREPDLRRLARAGRPLRYELGILIDDDAAATELVTEDPPVVLRITAEAASLEYDAGLYDASTIEALADAECRG
jgi:hypothetical protein